MLRPILLLLCVAPPVLAQPDWEAVDLGTTENFYAFSSGTLPWVVGANGFVASVANDYETWTTYDPGTTEDLLSIRVTSNRYVVGRNGTYRFSEDGGVTWQSADLPDAMQDYVTHIHNGTFFALGSGGAIYTDLGGPPFSWIERASGTTAALRAADHGALLLAVGDEGTMLQTTDLGENWRPVASGTTADLHAVVARGANDWLVVGEGGLILKSADGGQTWTPRASGTTETLYAIADVTGLRYLVAGENGTLLETRDLGETWCAHTLPTTATLRAVAAPQSDQWSVAGDGGVMLRSQTQGGGGCVPVANEPGAPEAGYTLSAPWPNPMRDRAALSLSVDRPQHVTAEAFDPLGRRIALLLDGAVAAGTPHTLVFERGALPAGRYLVRVRGEAFSGSRRATILP